MLVQFKVGNFLSFKSPVTLSLMPSAIREHSETHVFNARADLKLLKSAAVYGANGSGKSNLFHGMRFMKGMVRNSSKDSQAEEEIAGVDPFQLSTDSKQLPSLFEVVMIEDNLWFRYGFEVDRFRVHREWLYYAPKRQEVCLFYRDNGSIEMNKAFEEGRNLESKTRDNALFLSVVAQFNGEISRKVLRWFSAFNIISATRDVYNAFSTRVWEDDREAFMKLFKAADLGVEDIDIEQQDQFGRPVLREVKVLHPIYDANNRPAGFERFNLADQESEGSRKLFSLIGPVIDTLRSGKVLVVDELDSRLHPLITHFLISLFNSNRENIHNAQLVFNTHDTNLLTRKIFRRDQIWFTEKDRYGSSDLYSLVAYNVRNDASYEKDYLLGKYGSVPYLGTFEWSKNDEEVISGARKQRPRKQEP